MVGFVGSVSPLLLSQCCLRLSLLDISCLSLFLHVLVLDIVISFGSLGLDWPPFDSKSRLRPVNLTIVLLLRLQWQLLFFPNEKLRINILPLRPIGMQKNVSITIKSRISVLGRSYHALIHT